MLAETGTRWMDFGGDAGNAGSLGGGYPTGGGWGSVLCVYLAKWADWVREGSRMGSMDIRDFPSEGRHKEHVRRNGVQTCILAG